jgi:hypothetical protein
MLLLNSVSFFILCFRKVNTTFFARFCFDTGMSGKLSSPEGRTMIVEILSGVLGFIVMVLFVAVLVVIRKQRRHQPSKTNLSLIVQDNE